MVGRKKSDGELTEDDETLKNLIAIEVTHSQGLRTMRPILHHTRFNPPPLYWRCS